MVVRNSFPTGNPAGLPLLDTRSIVSGMIFSEPDGRARTGVLPPNSSPFQIVTATTRMAYRVEGFLAVSSRESGRAELVSNDGAFELNTVASPAANARYDVVFVRSRFTSLGDGSDLPEVGVVQGLVAPVGSLVKPALPAGSVELATIIVRAGSTATNQSGVTITNASKFTTFSGGTLLVRTEAELAEVPAIAGARALAWDSKTDWTYQGGWKRVFPDPETLTVAPGVLFGPAPPVGAKFRRIEGVFTCATTTTQGSSNIAFPTPFTGGVISANVQRYDFSVYGGSSHVFDTVQSLTQLNLRFFGSNGSPVASAPGVKVVASIVGWDRP